MEVTMPRTVFILAALLASLCLAVPVSQAGWLKNKLKNAGKDLGGKLVDDTADAVYDSTKDGAPQPSRSGSVAEQTADEPPMEEELQMDEKLPMDEETPWGGQKKKKKRVRRSSAQVRTDLHFSADSAGVDTGEEGGSYTGQMYVDGAHMRWDMNADMDDGSVGRTTIIVTGAAPEDEIYIVMPTEKMYMVSTVATSEEDFWESLRAEDNPCNGYQSAEKIGKRSVSGRETVRWECSGPEDSDTPESTDLWIDAKLGIPLRMESSDGSSFELSNIREGKPPADTFQLPAGYRKVSY
jgi:hypothetical protein